MVPRRVESLVEKTFKVHRQGLDGGQATEWWTPTRLQINDELCYVSSHPQFLDYIRKTKVLSDANVFIYPFEDEVSGHFIVKLQFLKDVAKDDELVWFVPEENLEGNTVHLNILYEEEHQERRMSLLRRFREQTPKEREDEGPLPEGEIKLMENEQWKEGATEVMKAVKEWGKTVLGDDYTLLEAGLYGPHGLIFSSKTWPALPQRPHFDSMFPFFSGRDVVYDSAFVSTLN